MKKGGVILKKYNYFDDYDDGIYDNPNLFDRIALPFKNTRKRISNGEFIFKVIADEFKTLKKEMLFLLLILLVIVFIIAIIIFANTIKSNAEKESSFNNDAGLVCSDIMQEYGTTQARTMSSSTGDTYYYVSGLAFVREINFDEKSTAELLVVYENNGEYFVEIWGYKRSKFTCLFSSPANTADGDIGAWISLYNDNGKYYLGIMDEEKSEMMLYTKFGNKFIRTKKCLYDAINDVYKINNELNDTDFETITFSYISSDKVQNMIDDITTATQDFPITLSDESNSTGEMSNEEIYDLYAQTVSQIEGTYGEPEYKEDSDICYIAGLSALDLVDFNGDGTDEMLIVYNYDKRVLSSETDEDGDSKTVTEPGYKLQIYTPDNGSIQMIYETDSLSTFQESEDEKFYILQYDGEKTNLCTNSYSYSSSTTRVWKGTSRIRSMTDDMTFESIFTAVANCSWGYMSYTIDGSTVYTAQFNEEGYKVPYFCNTDAYDESEFSVCFVSGGLDYSENVNQTLTKTQTNLKKLGL